MSREGWAWVGACSTGTSHIRAGTECQDYAVCLQFKSPRESTLIAVVSDGAGSAKYAASGSHFAVRYFASRARAYLQTGGTVQEITEEHIRDWLDDIRDRIRQVAKMKDSEPRHFAATLVAAIISDYSAVISHVGDGACVLRRAEKSELEVPTWPAHGEYASSTYFITDDPQPNLQFASLSGQFSEVALFSDGLERLALDFATKKAFPRFFAPMFAALENSHHGRNRILSISLRSFLNSEQVTQRTDDDKSLLLARRVYE